MNCSVLLLTYICKSKMWIFGRFQDETAADKLLYKGTFGTQVPGGLLKNLFQIAPRNVANTGILSTGDKCLALFEAGQPYSLDPVTLQTKGVDLLGGNIRKGAPFSTGWRFLDKLAGARPLLLANPMRL